MMLATVCPSKTVLDPLGRLVAQPTLIFLWRWCWRWGFSIDFGSIIIIILKVAIIQFYDSQMAF